MNEHKNMYVTCFIDQQPEQQPTTTASNIYNDSIDGILIYSTKRIYVIWILFFSRM